MLVKMRVIGLPTNWLRNSVKKREFSLLFGTHETDCGLWHLSPRYTFSLRRHGGGASVPHGLRESSCTLIPPSSSEYQSPSRIFQPQVRWMWLVNITRPGITSPCVPSTFFRTLSEDLKSFFANPKSWMAGIVGIDGQVVIEFEFFLNTVVLFRWVSLKRNVFIF